MSKQRKMLELYEGEKEMPIIITVKLKKSVQWKQPSWDSSAIKEQKNKLIDEWNINKFIDFLKKGEKKDGNI